MKHRGTVKRVGEAALFGALTVLMGVIAVLMWNDTNALIEHGVVAEGVVVGHRGLKYRDYIVAYDTVDEAHTRHELSVRIFPFAPEPAVGDLRHVVYDSENPDVATLSPPRRAEVLGPLAIAVAGAWATRQAVRGSRPVRARPLPARSPRRPR